MDYYDYESGPSEDTPEQLYHRRQKPSRAPPPRYPEKVLFFRRDRAPVHQDLNFPVQGVQENSGEIHDNLEQDDQHNTADYVDSNWNSQTEGMDLNQSQEIQSNMEMLLEHGLRPDLVGCLPGKLLIKFETFCCILCDCPFNSTIHAGCHYTSTTHMKRVLRWMDNWSKTTGCALPEGLKGPDLGPLPDRMKMCELCNEEFSALAEAMRHYEGRIHKLVVTEERMVKNPVLLMAPEGVRRKNLLLIREREFMCTGKKAKPVKPNQLKDQPNPLKAECKLCALEEDLENYLRFKLMGGNMRLKKNAVPHKFECQNDFKMPQQTGERRRRLKSIDEILQPSPQPSTSTACTSEIVHASTPFSRITEEDLGKGSQHTDKTVQVNFKPKHRSKGITVSMPVPKNAFTDTACSPIKIARKSVPFPEQLTSSESIITSGKSSSVSDYNLSSDELDSHDNEMYNDVLKNNMRVCYISTIERLPQLYLGIPEKMYHTISHLCNHAHAPVLDILICLKKIRLDFSYKILGAHFGLSFPTVCRIFNKTVPLLAKHLNELIIWPSARMIRQQLPISFIARYSKVQSIIDCLEIQIEKPSNALHQSLTWSDYKGCNTLKYLISCTPDGMVNFISVGYGGRATDSAIAEVCGYFDFLRPGMSVMADRGFKNISHMLQQRGCELVRPPSVLTNIKNTPREVKESKRIAALRIHVERVISRIREFHMLRMHATTDHNLIHLIDCIIVIVCGLINLQDSLIKI